MVKIITFFSHKGGVGTTTTAHNVAVALTKIGKNVLLIDADAQMNLTASVLGLLDSVEYGNANDSKWADARAKYTNIKDYLNWYTTKDLQTNEFKVNLFDYNPEQPLKQSKANSNTPLPFQEESKRGESKRGTLTLLLGDMDIFKLENKLYSIITNKLLSDDTTIFNIQEGIKALANYENKKYDFIIIDTSPSASSILNAVLVMMSDYFLCPVMPNFFSLQAINNMTDIMRNWISLLDNFRRTPNKRGLDFQPKFLGIVINMAKRFVKEKNTTTIYSEQWRNKINNSIDTFYQYAMESYRVLKKDEFQKIFNNSEPYIISEICDFTGQIRSISEVTGVPVVDLDNKIVKEGCEKIGCNTFTIKGNNTEDHYQRAFKDLSDSYDYIAESISKLI